MTTYRTGNPIGSTDPKDLYDNAENTDVFVNSIEREYWDDRFGRNRKTVHGMEKEFDTDQVTREKEFVVSQASRQDRFNDFIAYSGYSFLGDYASGIEITEYNQVLRDYNGEFWRLSGQVELPYTTTGAGLPEDGSFEPIGEAVLRQELNNPNQGAALIGRGVLAVDSIADLLALPPGQRREGLRYLVKGYHAGSDVGGGEFYWDPNSEEVVDEGIVFANEDDSIGRWKRITSDIPASPFWYGLPLVSNGIDNTKKLQAVLDNRYFKFPNGFKSSTSRLQLKSNSFGVFGDAEFKLLDSQPDGTQLLIMGKNFDVENDPNYVPDPCVNSQFFGGVFDGNKENNTATGNSGGAAGGDGGMHGLQIHDASNVVWHGSPVFRNCGTDGIIVWQRNSGTTKSIIQNVHIHQPICDMNGRQGVSVISCDEVTFYDLTASNSGHGETGKLPKAGIDIEGNTASDNVRSYFIGVTRCFGNIGRGFMTHTLGHVAEVYFDKLECHSNQATDGQVYLYVTRGGRNSIKAYDVVIYDGLGMASGTSGEYSINKIDIRNLIIDGFLRLSGTAIIDFGYVSVKYETITTDTAPALIGSQISGYIGYLKSENPRVGNNSFCLRVTGEFSLRINEAELKGSRGLLMSGSSNKYISFSHVSDATSSILSMSGMSRRNKVCVNKAGVSSTILVGLNGDCSDNEIDINCSEYPQYILRVSGSSLRNSFKINANRISGGECVHFTADTRDNLIYGSIFSSTTDGSLSVRDEGTNNMIMATIPSYLNS